MINVKHEKHAENWHVCKLDNKQDIECSCISEIKAELGLLRMIIIMAQIRIDALLELEKNNKSHALREESKVSKVNFNSPVNNLSTRYIPVTEWNNYHSYPKIGGLRFLIFNKDSNGFNVCVKNVGRRVLIDEAAFFEWLAKDKQKIRPEDIPKKTR